MSFILDALRKSEAERQQQAGAEFSDVPSSSGDQQSFKWLWILAIILLVNLVVLLGIFFRPDRSAEPAAPVNQLVGEQPATTQTEPTVAAEPTFEEQVEEARRNQPEVVPAEQPASVAAESPQPETSPAVERPYIKTIDELQLEGVLQVGELHVDIHVYAEEPAERFVFINMNKYTEGSQLAEGPAVKEIREDGVVLEHQGMVFLLPRE